MADKEQAPIIIKKKKSHAHGHHGGAWKIAYADFVTAMMAFFLLMWLVNATSEEQKRGIADFFSPVSVFQQESFSGGKMGSQNATVEGAFDGRKQQQANLLPKPGLSSPEETPEDYNVDEVAKNNGAETDGSGGEDELGTEEVAPNENSEALETSELEPVQEEVPPVEETDSEEAEEQEEGVEVTKTAEEVALEQAVEAYKAVEEEAFDQAKADLLNAIKDGGMEDLEENLLIEKTDEGLRIQIVDRDNKTMFSSGSSKMNENMEILLRQVSNIIKTMDKKIKITGHTDAKPFRGKNYTNWELSSDRSNASRRALVDYGVDPKLIDRVEGRASKDPYLEEDPDAAINRRISITLLKHNDFSQDFFDKLKTGGIDVKNDQPEQQEIPIEKEEKAEPEAKKDDVLSIQPEEGKKDVIDFDLKGTEEIPAENRPKNIDENN